MCFYNLLHHTIDPREERSKMIHQLLSKNDPH